MTRQLLPLLVIVGITLAGCSLAPTYIQPEAPVQAAWPQGDAYQTPASSGAPMATELSWTEFFSDVKLQKVLALALENNRDLRLAALNVERAQALYGIQRAELFPVVDASGGYSKQRIADTAGFGKALVLEQYNVDLGISAWELDFFGRIRSLGDQALETYLATEEARRSAQIALVGEVARTYLTLAAEQENLSLAQETLKTQRNSYAMVQKSYEVGIATELDLRRAQTPVEVARRDLARYRQLAAQDKNALDFLVGETVPAELLPADLSSVTPPKEISAGMTSEVLLQRPDILAAEHQLKGSYAFIGAARAAFFPRISLTTTLGSASAELSGLFSSGSQTWNFVPQITMPIFDARIWAAFRVSKADREIALTQYEKTIQTAFREVADSLAQQGTIDQQLAAQQALVEAATETYRLSEIRYTHGIDNYLGVLVAQRSQFAAQQVLVSLRLAKLANQVQLYAVLGGGVEQPGATQVE